MKETQLCGDAGITMITRRGFVKTGGALVVTLALPAERLLATAAGVAVSRVGGAPNTLDATRVASWLEIHSDNTILARSGRTETGTGMSGYYTQVIAEELRVKPEMISLVLGDTDRTPDGGYSAGFLTGMKNVRNVAAYTYQALLELAAKQLGSPVSSLDVADGVVTGNGQSVSYGDLVKRQELELKIPVKGELPQPDATKWVGTTTLDGIEVTGEPKLKPVKDFQVIGTSYPMPGTPEDEVELRRDAAGDAARANGAAGDARLDADFGWRCGQEKISDRGSSEEREFSGGSFAKRVGSRSRGRGGGCGNEVDRLGWIAWH